MIAAALLLAAGADIPRAQYKNATMGISLEEWRKLPFPGEVPAGEFVAPICTDLRDSGKLPDPLHVGSSEQALGVVKCAYYVDVKTKLGFLMGSVTSTFRKRVPIGRDASMNVLEYSFYRGRLFRVYGVSDLSNAADIVEGVSSRYGPASVTADSTVQSRAGATFPRKSWHWEVGGDAVDVEAPGGGRIDAVSVVYIEAEAAKIIGDERERRDPSASKM